MGIFSLILECIPLSLSARITKELKIPTIGIGAGKHCDGQVLVLYDFLGLSGKKLKFARSYLDLSLEIEKAVKKFIRNTQNQSFPSSKESFC